MRLRLYKRRNVTKIVFKLYFFYKKRFYILCLLTAVSFSLSAQEEQAETDTAFISIDSLWLDAIEPQHMRVSSNAIDKQVTYSAAGQVRRDIRNQQVILTNQAVVRYGDIEIKADSMVFNMANNTLFAIGITDSTGNITGSPIFKEGSNDDFNSKMIIYNFKTRQAFVKNTSTQQQESIIRSEEAKLLEDGTFNIAQSTYSTCDADPPHFYINIPKGRVYPGEKMVTGSANLVVEGIPLPLFIPFGYFPINTASSSSGIIFPTYGQERERGYSLTNMGYYFSINDYVDLSLRGNVYTNGTWNLDATSNYNKLYKFSGNFGFSYAKNVMGQRGLPGYSNMNNYQLRWAFNQDPKASPGSRFSASVNMSSSSYDQQNSYSVQDHVNTTRSSSISYSKTWAGTPFSLSTSMNHSQNVKNKTVDLNLPKVSLTMSRIYPLKMGRQTGRAKWYQDLTFQYSAAIDNRISTYDSLLFTPQTLDNMKNGFKHDAPLSLQIKPFKNFSISPSLTYSGVLYTQKIEQTWDPVSQNIVKDTIGGAFYGHALNPSISASYSPQIFGTFAFINPDARIQAVRHVMKPSIGFSFTPDHNLSSKMYKTVQADSAGTKYNEYSIFDGGIYGTPRTSGKNGSLSFGLTHIVEAKVFSKDDTTGIPKKVKLIDNLNMNTGYRLFADSLRWNDISMSTRTTLFENINISANSNFSIYALDENGREFNQLYYNTDSKLLSRLVRFKRFGASVDFSLDRFLRGSSQSQFGLNHEIDDDDDDHRHSSDNYYDYLPFDMPWTLNVSYNLSYEKTLQKPNITQGLSMNGSVTITKNMSANITTGYDFKGKEITMTQIGIQRDLHCWTMNFNWVPNGTMQMWNFTIRAKASVLSDLKYDRKKDFRDIYH